jgi:stress-induced morphogen
MSASDYHSTDTTRFNSGLRIQDLTIRDDSYAAVWHSGSGEQHWQLQMSAKQLKESDDTHFPKNLRMHVLELFGYLLNYAA